MRSATQLRIVAIVFLARAWKLTRVTTNPPTVPGINPFEVLHHRTRSALHDQAVFGSHLVDPRLIGLGNAAIELNTTIRQQIIRRHQGRFEAKDIAPLSGGILVKCAVEKFHLRTVENAVAIGEPAGELGVFVVEEIFGEVLV